MTKLCVGALRFAAETNWLQVISTMLWKLKALKFVQIKVVGHNEELQRTYNVGG